MKNNRPDFHFTAPKGWLNDPNGLIFDGKYYHMFYQYYPDSPKGGPKHWGHARSLDMYKWEDLPIALYPDGLGEIFSGSAVMDGDRMVLMYTYHGADGKQTQAIAYSSDPEFIKFEKYAGNPVIQNGGHKDFRDPKVFSRDADGWHMVLAAGDKVFFYCSEDLKNWRQTGSFGAPDNPVPGLWECPDMFSLKDADGVLKWVLTFSLNVGAASGGGKTVYFIGDFDGKTFIPDKPMPVPVDSGMFFYAGVTFWGLPDERRIMIAWMYSFTYAPWLPDDLEWRGQMSLPRELSLAEVDGERRLISRPVVKDNLVTKTYAGGQEVLTVTDSYSVEVFVPGLGIAITQALF